MWFSDDICRCRSHKSVWLQIKWKSLGLISENSKESNPPLKKSVLQWEEKYQHSAVTGQSHKPLHCFQTLPYCVFTVTTLVKNQLDIHYSSGFQSCSWSLNTFSLSPFSLTHTHTHSSGSLYGAPGTWLGTTALFCLLHGYLPHK